MQGGGAALAVPDRYQLGPGDLLNLRFWSPTMDAKDIDARVDARGSIVLTGIGSRFTVRGQTLAQAEASIRTVLSRQIRDVQLAVTLKELRSMPISVIGDAFLPGSYQVPSVATLFNTLYAVGGPAANGSLRRIELRRTDGSRRVLDLYRFLVNGEAQQDVPLQPGDTIFIPPAGTRVAVTGEVYRPAGYELLPTERLRDALKYAGGIKPSGITQRVSIEQNDPSVGRKQVDIDVTVATNNPPVYNDDLIEVTSVRPIITNAINLVGPVDQPGRFEWYSGMRVRNLIEKARGLLKEAYPLRADIFRQNDDGSSTLLTFNPSKALSGDPKDNVLLERLDKVVIYSYADVEWLGDRKVVSEGALLKPGTKYRSDNMNVYDLILQSGGLGPDAYMDQAFLQRINKDGTNGPLLKLDLKKVAQNDPSANVMLQDRDHLRVLSVREARYVPDETVELIGSALRPGQYPLATGLTIRDLIAQAGYLKPDATLNPAFLQRTNLDGTVGPLLYIDLTKAMAGDPSQNYVLQSRDKLTIYNKEQSQYREPQVVNISGSVQRPGQFPRSEGMKLFDLIALSGGFLPTAGDTIEIGASYTPVGTKPRVVRIADIQRGDPNSNVPIKDGDVVSVQFRSDILVRPITVSVIGAVKNPGPYQIDGVHDTLSSVLKRAGGPMPTAFLEGGQFARNPESLTTGIQKRLGPRISEVYALVQQEEYKRAVAQAEIQKLRLSTLAANASSTISLTGQQSTSDKTVLPVDSVIAKSTVTPARTVRQDELAPAGNLPVDFAAALESPNSQRDPILREGDVITIPEKPTTVLVTGAVILPSAVYFKPGATLLSYISQCGGITSDAADIKEIFVIHPNGRLSKGKDSKIELGDVIFLPTKVQAARLVDSTPVLERVASQATNAALLYGVIRSLSK